MQHPWRRLHYWRMTPLSVLLIIKIAVTLVAVALPMLLLPHKTIERLSALRSEPPLLFRLYGAAVLALLVGYSGGYMQVQSSEFPTAVVIMGLVSNGAATLILLRAPRVRWKPIAIAFFASITAGLAIALLNPELAMTRFRS